MGKPIYKIRLFVILVVAAAPFLIAACGGGGSEPSPEVTPTSTPVPSVDFITLSHPLGFTVGYPEEWVTVRDTSQTGVDPFQIVFDGSGNISRVVAPIVLLSARTEEAASPQQTFQIIIGPRALGPDGLVTSDREFNIHLRIFTMVKAEFLDRVQEDKDGFPRFVSEIRSPSSLPGTDLETHIFDHFWITDTATWQVTCSTSDPPEPEAESTCQQVLDSFSLIQ